MADDRAPWEPASAGHGFDAAEDLDELRELILGAERRRLGELERKLAESGLTAEELAGLLPEAIALRAGRSADRQLAKALAPTVESALGESIRRNPQDVATAIFPVLGPAIRKAIAEALAGMVASINSALEHSLSPRGLRWRLEAWRTGVPYGQIVLKHALVYRVEQVFLIHGETGLLLSHAWLPDIPADNADLISGMLTAIRDFVADSFQRERGTGGLRRASVGELNLVVEQGPRAVIACVVRGEPPETLLPRLQETLETIHLRFSGPLAEFDGDTEPFAPARPLLEECLATVVSTDRPRDGRGRAAWLPWVAALALLLGVLVWRSIRARQQWERAVARLSAEPGLVLTKAERDGSRWSFAGLRDPLAPDPAALLASLGADASVISYQWEPYYSLKPEMVLARARQVLAAPSAVQVALNGDTLRLMGDAPLAWVAATAARPALPPGVTTVDLNGLNVEMPAALAEAAQRIEHGVVLFDVGSARLGASARATANAAADEFRRLAAEVDALGGRATLELIGRTDATGTDAANQALSRDRAETVLAALVARGVPLPSTSVTPVGTTQPLPGTDPGEQARINRSVSFKVSLGWRGNRQEPTR